MAIFNPGSVVGQISGRIGGSVFSHNRGGAYIRNGAIPVTVVTDGALRVKAAMGSASQAWNGLTAAQRLAWNAYASSQTVTNRLGRSISLTGQNWFVGLSARLLSYGGPVATDPPITGSPAGVFIDDFECDAGVGDVAIGFGPTPLAANMMLWVRACKTPTGSITNFRNLLTTIDVSAAAQASPLDIGGAMEAAFGTMQVGAHYHVEVRVYNSLTGQVSAASYASAICVTT